MVGYKTDLRSKHIYSSSYFGKVVKLMKLFNSKMLGTYKTC